MNYGKPLKKPNFNLTWIVNFYFFFGASFIVTIFIIYVVSFQKQAEKEAKIVPNLVNEFMYFSGHENFENILTTYILQEIIAKIDYPIVILDNTGNPILWKNVGIDESAKYENLSPDQQHKILLDIDKMMKKKYYLPLYNSADNTIIGYTLYDDSRILRWIKMLPIIAFSFGLFFVIIGFYALSVVRKNEKRMIWVGLAKETAHQFGTPISSLIGWIDFMKMKAENSRQKEEFMDVLNDMNHDVDILKKVASRFGKVGSNIQLKPTEIDLVIMETIEYFKKRLPNFNNKIKIIYKSINPQTVIRLDEELITWAFENLIRNCIDAMKNKNGIIKIQSYLSNATFHILFKDTGVGINKSQFKKIFEPGVTTKERGWGLGLSLSKRIIEEYHHGKIKVLESSINKGTTIEIQLNAD